MTKSATDTMTVEDAERLEREAAQHLADLHGGIATGRIDIAPSELAQAEHEAEHARLVVEATRRLEAGRQEAARQARVAELTRAIQQGPLHQQGRAVVARVEAAVSELVGAVEDAQRYEAGAVAAIRELVRIVQPGDDVEARRDPEYWVAVLPSGARWTARTGGESDLVIAAAAEALHRLGRRSLDATPGAQAAEDLRRRLRIAERGAK